MTWLVFRQSRTQIFAWIGCLVVGAGLLIVAAVASQMHISASHLQSCVDSAGTSVGQPPDTCTGPEWVSFAQSFNHLDRLIYVSVLLLPPLVAAFGAAPLLATEFEHSTHLLVWTQGVTRRTWLTTKLCVAGVVAVLTACVVAVAGWPWLNLVARMEPRWARFELFVPDLAAALVFGVTAAIAVSAVLRRTVASMVVSLVLYGTVRGLFTLFVRPRLMPPASRADLMAAPSAGDWFLGFHYVDGAGREVTFQRVNEISVRAGTHAPAALQQQGIHLIGYFQPADRFWAFQGFEAAVFIVLAIILSVFALLWIERRSAIT